MSLAALLYMQLRSWEAEAKPAFILPSPSRLMTMLPYDGIRLHTRTYLSITPSHLLARPSSIKTG